MQTMASQSPVKKKPRLSLKLTRKENRNVAADDDDHSVPGDAANCDTNDANNYHMFDEQCALSEGPHELPPPYCGLNNLGNTCYFNSVLQALRYTPEFCDGLKNLAEVAENVEDESDASAANNKESRRLLRLVLKLNQLFEEMNNREEKFNRKPSPDQEMSVYPEEVLNSVRELNPMFQGYLQHDSQELLCSLLSKLQDASQKLLQITKEEKENRKRHKNSKLSLAKKPREKSVGSDEKMPESVSVSGSMTDEKVETERKCQHSSAETVSKFASIDANASKGTSKKVNGSVSQQTNGKKNESRISNGNGEVRARKRRSSSRDSDASNEEPAPQRKVKKKARSVIPSSGSVVKNKADMSGDHCSNGTSNGELSKVGTVNGSGDANGETSKESKANSGKAKRRLGLGRIRVPFNQPTILSKFGFGKKDVPPVNGISKSIQGQSEISGTENGTDSSRHLVNGVKTETNGQVCFNQTNNNSNQSQTHMPHSSEESTKSKTDMKPSSPTDSKLSPASTNSKKSRCQKTKVVSTPTDSKSGCGKTNKAATNDSEVECLGTVSSLDTHLQTVEKMFQGSLVLRTRCMECEGFTERREDFQDISVPVQRMEKATETDEDEQIPGRPNHLSLSWALSEFACAEKLTAENKYFCESCHHHAEAERTMLFGSLPPVLSVQLKRFCAFSGSLAFGGVSKVNDHLATPLTLSLTQWCTKQCRQRKQKYALYAVVMHSGVSSSSGHYVCYARIPVHQEAVACNDDVAGVIDRKSDEEVWAHFDDERVTVYSDHEFNQVLHPINGSLTTATPYLLFYKRIELF